MRMAKNQMDGMASKSQWFRCYQARESPKIRLFCFPHGGGGPQVYRTWGTVLPEDVEVWTVCLPGRGARLSEMPISSMSSLTPLISSALEEYLDMPYAFFGHSVGAIVCYDVARHLQAGGYMMPIRIFVSAHCSPGEAGSQSPQMHLLPDKELTKVIGDLGLVPAEFLQNAELIDLILPPIRSDFALSETYSLDGNGTLNIPISAFGGTEDPLLTKEDIQKWSGYSGKSISMKMYNGDHFYLEALISEVLEDLRKQLMDDWAELPSSIIHGPEEDYPHNRCLHELFREQAARSTDKMAITDVHHSMTFRELDETSDLIAQFLKQEGVGINGSVGIFMERSAEYVIAYLGILKAGGGYMPIEPTFPAALVARYLVKTMPVMVLTKTSYHAYLPDSWKSPHRSLCMDRGKWVPQLRQLNLRPLEPDTRPPNADSPAYFMMTSGTTGAPKSIRYPHRGAVNSYYWRYQHFPFEDGERVACNIFFLWEVLRPILQGFPSYVIPDDVVYDPRRLIDFLCRNSITRVLLTPSLLQQILDTDGLDITDKLGHLKVVWLNGEVVFREMCSRFFKVLPNTKLINDYSIAETHDVCTQDLSEIHWTVSQKYAPVGCPMTNVSIYVLDHKMKPVPLGLPGEIYVGGASIALDYLNDPERTSERFVTDPFGKSGRSIMFRTGDRGRVLSNTQLEVCGRVHFMVKIRGYSIVPGAVEAAILEHPAVRAAVVLTADNETTRQPEHLLAYIVGNGDIEPERLDATVRSFLKDRLPLYAIPSFFIPLDEIPIDPVTAKLDRPRLPKLDQIKRKVQNVRDANARTLLQTNLEKTIAAVWGEVLGVEPSDMDDNFFDLGGHSLLAAQMTEKLSRALGARFSVVDIFEHPTVHHFSQFVSRKTTQTPSLQTSPSLSRISSDGGNDIAVVGMSCRFPGGISNHEGLWNLLKEGGCGVRQLSVDHLKRCGISDDVFLTDGYVKVGAHVEDVDLFDNRFWGLSEKEVLLMDPQHRIFLTCAWEAFESAGIVPGKEDQITGVFGGCYLPSYLLHYLKGAGLVEMNNPVLFHLSETGNDKDYLTTRVSYMLNLKGPSLSVQSSCSTGLSTIIRGCNALLSYECDMALCGASSISFPQGGYQYQEGHVLSHSGVCKAYDATADGTILGDGVAVVLIKRLKDAVASRDHIFAVIKGFATNNDGNSKLGFSAPSVQGQADVIRRAFDMAQECAGDITFIEGHGTGTLIGDPIEVRALTQVFQQRTQEKQYCALGSVKANLGHSNIAAGMAGFLKTVLSIYNKQIPPTINFTEPNPELNLEESPFYINTKLENWHPQGNATRKAGVSSFGIGGTNCHIVLEEAPFGRRSRENREGRRTHLLITLSAKSDKSLDGLKNRYVDYFLDHKDIDATVLKNVAYSLHVGRVHFPYRLAVSCNDVVSGIQRLRESNPQMVPKKSQQEGVVFMFPGQGSQYLQMGYGLYLSEVTYRQHFDRCCDIAKEITGSDFRQTVFAFEGSPEAAEAFSKAYDLQAAIFAVEYSLAMLLMSWGIKPCALVGHSLGEYIASCIAGMHTLEEAITLVIERAYAIEKAPQGAMLSVKLSKDKAQTLLQNEHSLSLGSVNSPNDVVLSGPYAAIERMENILAKQDVAFRRLHVFHAFHSTMMDDAAEVVSMKSLETPRKKPTIPVVSNMTGTWIDETVDLDPDYWHNHMLQPVLFSKNIEVILEMNPKILLEVGPGRTLSTLVKKIIGKDKESPIVLSTTQHPKDKSVLDADYLCKTLGQLWMSGQTIDWNAYHQNDNCRRVPIPTYFFDEKRIWPDDVPIIGKKPVADGQSLLPLNERFHITSWVGSLECQSARANNQSWLLFVDNCGIGLEMGNAVAEHLKSTAATVSMVYRIKSKSREERKFFINPKRPDDYIAVLKTLKQRDEYPSKIVNLWSLLDGDSFAEDDIVKPFYHLLYIAKAVGEVGTTNSVTLLVVTQGSVQVTSERLTPVSSTAIGPAMIFTQENPQHTCRLIDIQPATENYFQVCNQVIAECTTESPDGELLVAWRGGRRLVQRFTQIGLGAEYRERGIHRIGEGKCYIITGGLGRIGMTLAGHLARYQSRMLITTRRSFPEKSSWKHMSQQLNTPERMRDLLMELLNFEKQGAQVYVETADVSKFRHVRQTFDIACSRFGDIDGIFHAAGVANLKYLDQMSFCICDEEFDSKVYGTLNIDRGIEYAISQGVKPPKFVVMFSSMASILGGYGMAAYAAANRFLDSFAQVKALNSSASTKWISINWDDWDFNYGKEQTEAYGKTRAKFAMKAEDGIDSLDRILGYAERSCQIMVSTTPMSARVDRWLHQTSSTPHPGSQITNRRAPVDYRSPNATGPAVQREMSNNEQIISGIYRRVLGVADLCPEDNFFDLGGDSVLAAQITVELQRAFPSVQRIHLRDIFANPSVVQLADFIATDQPSI